ncbi:response regulator [Aquisalimonas sp.]|uniref:response regulator transcription factor n=1 Tax=unclassified Aquisalimonas TaxID=2644645 RepID=UPI0025BFBB21|nr:response regulator [Aquisalimonas sp.]
MAHPVVYIIDNDEAVRSALGALIKAHGWSARSFDSASAFLEAGIPAEASATCLLVDVELDGMSGVELQDHLLELGHALPTVIVTARPDQPVIRRKQAGGALTVLGKPFEADDLIQAIGAAMAST